jgi:hypothetical protein
MHRHATRPAGEPTLPDITRIAEIQNAPKLPNGVSRKCPEMHDFAENNQIINPLGPCSMRYAGMPLCGASARMNPLNAHITKGATA